MKNFSIQRQVEDELDKFRNGQVKLAAVHKPGDDVRMLRGNKREGYFFNQLNTLTLIDLYYNSKFENGELDKLKQRKIFLNIGKFRAEVASKQIDLDTKDFRFIPDDYADPWTAFFMQKDFKEWSKDSDFAEIVNECVDTLPKYGSVVLKKVGKKLVNVPLQNLRNEISAKSLTTASFVIEEHADMPRYEIDEMKSWNSEGLKLKFNETLTVYERYGHVPLGWLNMVNKRPVTEEDWNTSVDALVVMAIVPLNAGGKEKGVHIFYAEQCDERPYREAHWTRQHGRWLGVGVMEDLLENQVAKNIVVNLQRRSLHWSAKRVGQSANAEATAKNLAKDVADGTILEVGQNGNITMLDMSQRNTTEFQQFLGEFEKNSDQKAFTYEVATGARTPSSMPATIGVILSKATNAYYEKKREHLGLFLKAAVNDFLVPQFVKDMSKKDRVVLFFSDEPGFEALKAAAMQLVKSEMTRYSLLGKGEPVDPNELEAAIDPFEAVRSLPFLIKSTTYQEAKVKFDLSVTGEETDLEARLASLNTLYQVFASRGDSRAEKVLERMAALGGENLAVFGLPAAPAPVRSPIQVDPAAAAAAQQQ